MGTLTKYSLKNTQCSIFFETGTGLGHSLKHAADSRAFSMLYSSEIHRETAKRAVNIFANYSNVKILNANSEDALKAVLSMSEKTSKIFFFLDAHFPGEVSATFAGYDNVRPSSVSLPLERELSLIRNYRGDCDDIIVVDDLRIYEENNYENGNLPEGYANIPTSLKSLHFVREIFPDKKITRDFRDDGYLIIQSKNSQFSLRRLSAWQRMLRTLKRRLT